MRHSGISAAVGVGIENRDKFGADVGSKMCCMMIIKFQAISRKREIQQRALNPMEVKHYKVSKKNIAKKRIF